MAELTKEELKQALSDLQKSNDVLQQENARYAQNQTQLAALKKSAEDDLEEIKEELEATKAKLEAAIERNQELADDLEAAETQVPVKSLVDGEARPAGVYLKDKILFITGFGHVRKEDGPLTKKQLEALRKDFDPAVWSDSDIQAKFLDIVE